jgi:asparagine synthase (glutamine-hydrolysing)
VSAIAGIYYRDDQRLDRTDLERMVESVAHRGPDGAGIWRDGAVGIGHRMFWTTPEFLRERIPLTPEPKTKGGETRDM